MLKFKMSLLLQSAKFRVAVAVLAITAIIAGIVFIPKNKAGVPSNSVQIKMLQGMIIYFVSRKIKI